MELKRRGFLKGIAGLSASLAIPASSPLGATGQPAASTASRPQAVYISGLQLPSDEMGTYYQLTYPPSQETGQLPLEVQYTLWVPAGLKRVRSVIVHQHGASILAAQGGSTAAYDLHWQELARKWDSVLLGPSYHVLNDAIDLTPGGAELWFDPRHGSERTFLRSLNDFARMANLPGIGTAPWCLWGHSGGGIWSNVMAALHPERVVAMWLRSGTASMFRSKGEFPQPVIPQAFYEIPMMANAGVLEKTRGPWQGSIDTFHEYRAAGASIGFAPDPRTAHFCGDQRYLAIPFMDACMAMRLPEVGSVSAKLRPVDLGPSWLAAFGADTAYPAAAFNGDAKTAVWLLNESIAKKWMAYIQTATVPNGDKPPAPINVRVSTDASGGNLITWNARADLEAGIGGFVIMRDGRGLMRLPERAPDRLFGRPLYQGLSFHDTPEAPLIPMRFLDRSPKPGVKHVYAVIALSSAGVASDLSAPGNVQ
jgi:hypothetical protein